MKARTINEVNFERNIDPKEAMETGAWEIYKPGIFIPLQEFKDKGGKLEKGREIYNANGTMKAKTINEYNFERGIEPKDSMGTGAYEFYSIHINDDGGYSIPIKIRPNDDIIEVALQNGLISQYEADNNDYIEEIDEELYKAMGGKL